MTLYEAILAELADAIESSISDQSIQIDSAIFETPPNATLGDIAFPCFSLAKSLKKNPVQIARDITNAIHEKTSPLIARTEAKGAYVNFFLSAKTVASKTLAVTLFDPLHEIKKKKRTPIVLEYVSPNTNKPLHLGHVRNAFLGDSIARLLECTGTKVHKTCLVNDRGIHICKSMVAYQHGIKGTGLKGQGMPTPKTENKKGDHFVGEYYVRFETMAKKDPAMQDAAAECLKKWEANDTRTRILWKKMNAWVLKGFDNTFKELGISFDKTYYESAIYNQGRDLIHAAFKKGIFKKDETGAVIAPLEQYKLPDKVLLRKDGTSIYITQDIYLAYTRAKDFNNSPTLYVVGSEQDTYFNQLFQILKIMGFEGAQNLVHVSYGMVNLPEGRMKSREGTVVDADDLIEELKGMAYEILDAREEKLSKKEREKRTHTIALAALKYYILEVNSSSDMIFNPKESISFHGRTGPYILYTYARLKSILRKSHAKEELLKKQKNSHYSWTAEKNLLLLLAQFSFIVEHAAHGHNPAAVAKYLYQVAKTTNEYYHENPVLNASPNDRNARLALVAATAQTLRKGLSLLGISVLEKM
ncbi:arginine--tRNA ligase [Candidatus Uhrbacteria bacterium]|nr:arginine--tRNA ligase [Candidatus Uhrbacteria bacterium]